MSEISHPLITRLKVKNYRSLADVDIKLNPLTVFVGKNGTGKSNVIDVLRFVRDALTDGFEYALLRRGGIRAVRCWLVEETEKVSIQLHFEGADWEGEYGFAFGQETRRGGGISLNSEHLTINGTEVFSYKSLSKKSFYLSQMANQPHVAAVRDFLANMNFYDLSPSYLRKPQQVKKPFPLAETGENLASALLEFKNRHEDDLITESLGAVVEGVDGYLIEAQNGHLVTKLHYTFQNGRHYEFSSELKDEADGTIRLLSILTALYQDRYPSPLVIEEPEKAIYTDTLALLCGEFQNAAGWNYQVLITTHRPDLIDDLPVESLLVVEKEDGMTKIGPLISEQQQLMAEQFILPGELMQIQGLYRENSVMLVRG